MAGAAAATVACVGKCTLTCQDTVGDTGIEPSRARFMTCGYAI